MEILFVQAIIVVFLLTFLWTEEVILRPHYERELVYFEEEFWFNRLEPYYYEPVGTPPEFLKLDRVAAGMDLAGWHPKYGAEGWEGV